MKALPSPKSLLPIGIYGRAYLILFFPVTVILLVVFIVFVQRHFDRVTRQMVSNFEPNIQLVLTRIEAASNKRDALSSVEQFARQFDMTVAFPEQEFDLPATDRKRFYDLSGRVVINTLRQNIPGIVAIDLMERGGRYLRISVETIHGKMLIGIRRAMLSPSNPHQFLVLIVLTSALTTVIAFLFLRNQLRPIRRLALAAEAFGRGESMDLSVSGATEVRSATRAFLDMRRRIERHLVQRTQMLSNISHDLKTPLTRLRIGIELLDDHPDKQSLIRDVQVMDNMISEFLVFSKSGESEVFADIDPAKLLESVVNDSAKTGHFIELRYIGVGANPITLRCKPMAIRRSLENLVSNATKYANRCLAELRLESSTLVFVVEDDGPGISEKDRETVIRPFVRLDSSRNLNVGEGTGLGLAIASDVAVEHGGKLILERSDELGGLKAELRLPIQGW